MTQRKYREVTEADIGKMIEVADERHAKWHKSTLQRCRTGSKYPFQTNTGSVWKYARIEVTDDPA
jgi:hypothetical protein